MVDDVGMGDMDDDAVTKCLECHQEMTNAKCLPCSHTFCCACLESLCRKMIPGGQQTCPQCKQPFRVPTHGCSALPDNTLVRPLQRLRKEMASTRQDAERLSELNKTLEAHNIEAGSK